MSQFLTEPSERYITYVECAMQAFFGHVYGTASHTIVMIMALDRYVAICNPLRYPTIMSNNMVVKLSAGAWVHQQFIEKRSPDDYVKDRSLVSRTPFPIILLFPHLHSLPSSSPHHHGSPAPGLPHQHCLYYGLTPFTPCPFSVVFMVCLCYVILYSSITIKVYCLWISVNASSLQHIPTVTEEWTYTTTGFPQAMDVFRISETLAPPVPPTPMSAVDRLIGLLQFGRSLERYVEEFVELAYLTNWSDARLNALFLSGLDESTTRFEEPDDYVSLNYTINLILYLNGSKFIVEEVPDFKCSSRPVPPETWAAWPVRQPPSSSTCPSSELFPCVLLDPHTSAGSRGPKKRRRRKKPACLEPAPALSETVSPVSSEPSPVSTEPSAPAAAAAEQVPVGGEHVGGVPASPDPPWPPSSPDPPWRLGLIDLSWRPPVMSVPLPAPA
ncbi:Olfactory receptor 4C11 [Anabarilius grahami]|uniref:Olfactory receptor 4C11 n=1 Tax=Anabarilius grahami TaxID=495550 RepID=A0A3N0XPD1_ANAGA|nr:Olfactory receptor 4C11 [Anabarilius grahami]